MSAERRIRAPFEVAALQVSDARGTLRVYQRPDEVRKIAERVFEWPRKPEGCVTCGEEAVSLRANQPLCGGCRTKIVQPHVHTSDTRFVRAIDADSYVMHGYGIVFDQRSLDLGGFYEYVRPQATDRTMRKHAADVRGLWNHDTSLVLGRTIAGTLALGADHTGVSVGIDPPTWAAGHVDTVRRRDVTGMSFRFRTLLDEWRMEGDDLVRDLLDIEFDETSAVSYPAYPSTTLYVSEASPSRGRDWKPSLSFRQRQIRAAAR